MDKAGMRKWAPRLLSVLLSFLLMAGTLPPIARASESYPVYSQYGTEQFTKIAVTSDLHLTENSYNRMRFATLLKAMEEEYDPDMVLICGDTYTTSYSPPTASSYPDPVGTSFTNVYDEIRTVVDYYMGETDFPIVIIPGNHDYEISSTYFTENSGFDSYYGVVPTGNYDVFMFGAPPTTGMVQTNFSDAQINALQNYLADRADKTKPLIVISHYPIDDSDGHQPPGNSSTVMSVMANSGQPIMFLWGHNHTESVREPGSDFSNLLKTYDNYITVNAGAIGYRGSTDISQGLEMTLDTGENTMNYQMMRINTTTSIAEVVADYTQDIPDGSAETDAQTPNITGQPGDRTVAVGGTATLSVTAAVSRGVLSYQWYSNATDSNSGGTLIEGAVSSGYSAPTSQMGTAYYYCEVTNTDTEATGEQTATIASEAARVMVVDASGGWDGSIATDFGGGSGTSGNPYLITNGAELAYLAQQVDAGTTYSGSYFLQTADIDLNSLPWTPIGEYRSSQGSAVNYPFAGTYDGDGYIVSNLYADESFSGTIELNKSFGLFGYLTGTVKNVGVTNVHISVTNTNTGSDAGTFNAYAGGITGYLSAGDSNGIFNCYAQGSVSASTSSTSARCAAGGLAGYSYTSGGVIANSYGAVTAAIGGTHGTSTNCGAGGLVGYIENGSISGSYWNTELTDAAAGSGSVTGATGKSTSEMKDAAFVALLNENAGSYKAWMADTGLLNEGYPIHERQSGGPDAQTPIITGQPEDKTVAVGAAATLSVTAAVSRGDLSYQWYSNAVDSNSGGTFINEAISSSYSAPTSETGTTYYYCEVTNTDTEATGSQTAMIASEVAKVEITEASQAWDGVSKTEITLGSGSEADPYQVWTGADLAWMADQVNNNDSQSVFEGQYFKQMADIDLGSHEWTPIGKYVGSGSSSNQRFYGIYDGDGHIITHLYVNITVSNDDTSLSKGYGLFGILYGTVKNLGIVGASVSVTNSSTSDSPLAYAGGIAGYVGTAGTSPTGYIYNCYVTGTIQASGNYDSTACCAGSLGGYLARAAIENSYGAAACSISGSFDSTKSGAGGIAGRKGTATFTNCCWDSTKTSYPMDSSASAVSGTTGYDTTACKDGTLLTALQGGHDGYLNWMADIGINSGYPIHMRAVSHDNAQTPSITGQPEDRTVSVGGTAVLSVTAAVSQGELSYQWYSNTQDSSSGGTFIDGAILSSYSAPTSETGTTYYYCEVTNTDDEATVNQTAMIASEAAKVEVTEASQAWDGSIADSFGGGSGTSGDPYQIANGAQLAYLGQRVNAGESFHDQYFVQTADIDLNNIEWTPIGIYTSSSKIPFSGIYDGDGHIVSNLRIDQSFDNSDSVNKAYGLFTYVNKDTDHGATLSGTIMNLGVTNVYVHVINTETTAGNAYAAGLCGYLGYSSKPAYIYNCYVEGETYAETHYSSARCAAGGLAGYFINGTITNSYAAVNASIGGSYSTTGSSSGNSGAGGLVGHKESNGSFSSADPSYWNSTRTADGMNSSSSSVTGATAKTDAEMKDAAFAALLSSHHNSYKNWMTDSPGLNEGYPIHFRPLPHDDAETPDISVQPADVTTVVGGAASVSVTVSVGVGTLSYQWYGNTTRSSTGGTLIPGATSDSYTVPTSSAYTDYVYCVVTNTDPTAAVNQTATAVSDAAQVTVNTLYSGGSGTGGDPYLISTRADLEYMAQQVNDGTNYAGKYFRQTADIDLQSIEWTPIGVYVSSDDLKRPFCGSYDGDGYIIANLKIDVSIDNSADVNKAYGLFSYLNTTDGSSGTIQNLGLTNAFVHVATQSDTTGNAYAAGLCGYVGVSGKSGYIHNCYVEGDFYAQTHSSSARCAAGGLAGFLTAGSVTNSYAAVTAAIDGSYGSSYAGAGGLAGWVSSGGSFSSCYWDTTLTSEGVNAGESVSGVAGMTTAEMKETAFVALLNENRDIYKAWTADEEPGLNDGYPIHERSAGPIQIEGTVEISGSAIYGETLTADTDGVTPAGATLSYQWKRNGTTVGTEATYTVAEADIDQSLTVTVTGTEDYTGSIDSGAVTPDKAGQAAPAAPTLQSKTSDSVTLDTDPGYEYSMNSGAWQASGQFTGLSAGTEYSFNARVAETGTHYASPAGDPLAVTTDRITIGGTVEISGSAIYGETLTADISGVTPAGATLSYQWKRNGTTVGTEATYTVIETDVGQSLTVTVNGTGAYTGSRQSGAVTPDKADVSAPEPPTLQSKSCSSVTLNTAAGYEYRMEGGLWQSGGYFAGLTANTEYRFYARVAETGTHYASPASDPLTVTTDIYLIEGAVGITGSAIYGQTLTADISGVTPAGATLSYQWKRGGTVVGSAATYTVAEDDIGQSLTVTVTGTGDYTGSVESGPVTPDKAAQAAPAAPTLQSKTSNSVTLNTTAGYQYRMEDGEWQSQGSFTGLSADTEYRFYARAAETGTHYASPAGEPLAVTTDRIAIGGTVVITGTAAYGQTLTADISGVTPAGATLSYQWKRGGTVVGAEATYTVAEDDIGQSLTVTVTGTGDYTGSRQSEAVTPDKAAQTAPAAPTLQSKTSSSVTLNTTSGYEYRVEGGEWRTDGSFTGLAANTGYKFYARVAETGTHHASPAGDALTVTTDRIAIGGTVNITGAAIYGQTLTADTGGVTPAGAALSYQWKRGGTVVGTEATYTVAESDIGQSLTVTVTGTGNYTGSKQSSAVTPDKAAQTAPAAPSLQSKTHGSVTLNTAAGYEYRMEGGEWRTDGSFTGLAANTEYRFYARAVETGTHHASPAGDALTVTTNPDTITSARYAVNTDKLYISGIGLNTTVQDILDAINEKDFVKVFNGTEPVSETDLIGTGMTVKLMDADTVVQELTVVVTGDINGDGKATLTDFIHMKSCLLGKTTLQGAYESAADVNGDGKFTLTDYIKMKAHLLEKETIQPQEH